MSTLVADDNPLLASKVLGSLVRANRSVRTATSIARAREIPGHDPPRVLCLDLPLTDGNGRDLVEALRREGMSLPVGITSGHDSRENRPRTQGRGTAAFFAKPRAPSARAARAAAARTPLVAVGIMAARHGLRATATGAAIRLIPIGGTG